MASFFSKEDLHPLNAVEEITTFVADNLRIENIARDSSSLLTLKPESPDECAG